MSATSQILLWGAALATTLASGCGGGGSSSGSISSPSSPVRPGLPGAPAEPAIVVSQTNAPAYSAADCPRFLSTGRSVAALDLRNRDIKAVNDFLADVDPHARAVFARRPYDFVNWVALTRGRLDLVSAGAATHETIHQVSNVLRDCEPRDTYKVLFFGDVLVTGVRPGASPSMRVVARYIDPALVGEPRFDTYIIDAARDNDLSILIDEFAAYTAAAHTELQMLESGRTGGFTGSLDGNLGGMVNLMVFLQTYLKAVRLDHPVAYRTIEDDFQTTATIQAVWTRAEQNLRDAFDYVEAGILVVNRDYLDAAYSERWLAELDALEIAHASRRSWSSTYLP